MAPGSLRRFGARWIRCSPAEFSRRRPATSRPRARPSARSKSITGREQPLDVEDHPNADRREGHTEEITLPTLMGQIVGHGPHGTDRAPPAPHPRPRGRSRTDPEIWPVHSGVDASEPPTTTLTRIATNKDVPSALGVAALVAGADGSRRHPVSYPSSADAAHTTAPRGATSTAATPRPYSNMCRSPCLARSTPESCASVETTCSTTSSALTVSDSSYVTSM
jgi:hypothetical protein